MKGSFFKQRRFLDRADLEQQLRAWLTETNTVRPSRACRRRSGSAGVPPATAGEDRAGGSGAPHPGEREPDGRGPTDFPFKTFVENSSPKIFP